MRTCLLYGEEFTLSVLSFAGTNSLHGGLVSYWNATSSVSSNNSEIVIIVPRA
jgi:hypothetical protein